MAQPYDLLKLFLNLPPDFELIETLRKKEQKEYLRTRLRAIELLWRGWRIPDICAKLDIHRESVLNWMKIILFYGVSAGLRRLCVPKHTPHPRKLPPAAQQELCDILEQRTPHDFKYIHFTFTGRVLQDLILKQWDITLSDQSVYNLLHDRRFSYQRAHRDYLEADPLKQKQYVQRLCQRLQDRAPGERIVFFDEFALSSRPTLFYGWARVNTRYQVRSRERQRHRVNGLLSVDAVTGELFLQFSPRARAEELVPYFRDLALDSYTQGYAALRIVLDGNPAHKDKLRYAAWQAVRAHPELQDFTLRWEPTPAYSPDFNLAEYLIHQLRLQCTHHCPVTFTLPDLTAYILDTVKNTVLQTPEQIKKTINHIFALADPTCRI